MKQKIFSRLSKRGKIIFYISLAAIFAGFSDRVVIHPVMNKLKKLNEEIVIQEKKLENSAHIVSRESLITKEHKESTQYVKQNQSDEEEIAKFLTAIEKLASKCSIFLADIKPGSIEEVNPYKKYNVKIEIESEIAYLVDFMYQLERHPRMLRVNDFYCVPKEENSAILKAHLTITQILTSAL